MRYQYTDETQTRVKITSEAGSREVSHAGFLVMFSDDPAGVPAIEPYQQFDGDAVAARGDVAAKISAKCGQLIEAGLTSSALGAPHTYPSKERDQTNLAANVQLSTLPANASNPDWLTWHLCADSTGAWQFRPHSAAQIQQASADIAAAILALRMANATKIADLDGLTFAEILAYDIESGWPS